MINDLDNDPVSIITVETFEPEHYGDVGGVVVKLFDIDAKPILQTGLSEEDAERLADELRSAAAEARRAVRIARMRPPILGTFPRDNPDRS